MVPQQFSLCDILNSISITFSFPFFLFSVTVFRIYKKASATSILLKFRLFHEFFGETSPEYGIDSSFCYFSHNINIFHVSFQFFALLKCRSCSISIVVLVCNHSKTESSFIYRVMSCTYAYMILSSEFKVLTILVKYAVCEMSLSCW